MNRLYRTPVDAIVLGHTLDKYRRPIYLTVERQRSHATIFGKTGSGKSRLLQSLFLQHLSHGKGVILFDPHHDTAMGIIRHLVDLGFFTDADAFERLVYLDFGGSGVVPYNTLATRFAPKTTALLALEAMFRVWPDLHRAPAFQTLFLAGTTALAYQSPRLPITFLYTLLTNREFLCTCLERVNDPLVYETLNRYAQSTSTQDAASLLRRAFLLSFSDLTKLSFGQLDSVIDFRSWFDQGKSVIINLGNVDDAETRNLLTALLLVQLEQAALSRKELPEQKRRQSTVLIDEWASVAPSPETLASIMTQLRKYGIFLYLAGQSTAQAGADTFTAALENTRLHIAFGLGRQSALDQAKELATPERPDDRPMWEQFFFPRVDLIT